MNTWGVEAIEDHIGEQEVLALFQQIDINNDGFINHKELKIMLKALGEKGKKKDVKRMMKEADLNNDGKISYSGMRQLKFFVSYLN